MPTAGRALLLWSVAAGVAAALPSSLGGARPPTSGGTAHRPTVLGFRGPPAGRAGIRRRHTPLAVTTSKSVLDTDPYAMLGVPVSATRDDIKAAYRARARGLHPDAVRAAALESAAIVDGDSAAALGLSSDAWSAVSDAYALLMDKGRKAEYDTARSLSDTTAAAMDVATRIANVARPLVTDIAAPVLNYTLFSVAIPAGKNLGAVASAAAGAAYDEFNAMFRPRLNGGAAENDDEGTGQPQTLEAFATSLGRVASAGASAAAQKRRAQGRGRLNEIVEMHAAKLKEARDEQARHRQVRLCGPAVSCRSTNHPTIPARQSALSAEASVAALAPVASKAAQVSDAMASKVVSLLAVEAEATAALETQEAEAGRATAAQTAADEELQAASAAVAEAEEARQRILAELNEALASARTRNVRARTDLVASEREARRAAAGLPKLKRDAEASSKLVADQLSSAGKLAAAKGDSAAELAQARAALDASEAAGAAAAERVLRYDARLEAATAKANQEEWKGRVADQQAREEG